MTPICIVARRIKRLPLAHQISHIRALVAKESPRSIRRVELEALLRDLVTRQLRKENRAA